jgi:hypothetical protein
MKVKQSRKKVLETSHPATSTLAGELRDGEIDSILGGEHLQETMFFFESIH